MRVALNATCFNHRPSGAKQRFLGIYGRLVHLMPNCEFIVFEPADCRMDTWFENALNVRTIPTPIPSEGRFVKFVNAFQFWKQSFSGENFDIFEGFHLPFPSVSARKRILTIHDVRRLHPDWGWTGRSIFRFSLNQSLKNVDLVITVSDAMKQELLPICNNVPIRVIPNGIDVETYGVTPNYSVLESFQTKYSLPENFILAVGHLEIRKNYHRLLDAISILRNKQCICHLLIIGNNSGEGKQLDALIRSLDISDQVTILSGLSDQEVRSAYELCRIFVFPSLYEGFGIPVLEAMAAGKPMVLADIPVFKEITEGKCIYFDSKSATDIALKINDLLFSPKEQIRQIASNLSRVNDFNYKNIALQYQHLFCSLTN